MKKLTERCWKMLVLILLFQPGWSVLFVLSKERLAARSSVLGHLCLGSKPSSLRVSQKCSQPEIHLCKALVHISASGSFREGDHFVQGLAR